MTIFATALAFCCVAWAIVAGLLAMRYCKQHGARLNPALLGIEMLRCLSRYKKSTMAESGHAGPLFYHYVVTINTALILAMALVLVQFI